MLTISQAYHSPNHESREGAPISLIVLHATVGSLVSARGWLTNPASKASTHYLISKQGEIYQLVSEDRAAWHAGRSLWGGLGSLAIKQQSIGIELENANDGRDPYPAAQVDALRSLVHDLQQRHPQAQIVTHAQIAQPPGRKSDPLGFDVTLLRPRPSPPTYTEHSPILGAPLANQTSVIAAIQLAHAERRMQRQRPQPKYPDVTSLMLIIGGYFDVCAPVGINTDLAIAQMLHETDWLCSDWCDRPRRNPAGIGVNGNKQRQAPDDPTGWALLPDGLWHEGLSFPNWYASVPAHVGRLVAYALAPEARSEAQAVLAAHALAYRPLPLDTQGSAPTLKPLGKVHNPSGRGWAQPGAVYGAKIATIANTLAATIAARSIDE